MKILAIETSCDETAVAIIEASNNNIRVLSNVVSSQVKIHAKWGGVVPNLAAREHLKNIIPVLRAVFNNVKIKPENIDLIAVTQGPGLIPALLVGTNVAKTLSYCWQKPLLGIHHIEGHIYANFVRDVKSHRPAGETGKSKVKSDKINFPILCLVVSGGHTQLVLMKKHLDYQIVGQTLDDAAGEAFDKVARILKLGYPGGPIISKMAANYKLYTKNYKLALPRPMINSKDFNFSFSGLKTAVLYEAKKHSHILQNVRMLSAICTEFQQSAIDVLVAKTIKAARKYHPKTIMLAGGVSANKELRKQLGEKIKKEFPNTKYQLLNTNYSIDNAAMIATAAFYRWQHMSAAQRKTALRYWRIMEADANMKLK